MMIHNLKDVYLTDVHSDSSLDSIPAYVSSSGESTSFFRHNEASHDFDKSIVKPSSSSSSESWILFLSPDANVSRTSTSDNKGLTCAVEGSISDGPLASSCITLENFIRGDGRRKNFSIEVNSTDGSRNAKKKYPLSNRNDLRTSNPNSQVHNADSFKDSSSISAVSSPRSDKSWRSETLDRNSKNKPSRRELITIVKQCNHFYGDLLVGDNVDVEGGLLTFNIYLNDTHSGVSVSFEGNLQYEEHGDPDEIRFRGSMVPNEEDVGEGFDEDFNGDIGGDIGADFSRDIEENGGGDDGGDSCKEIDPYKASLFLQQLSDNESADDVDFSYDAGDERNSISDGDSSNHSCQSSLQFCNGVANGRFGGFQVNIREIKLIIYNLTIDCLFKTTSASSIYVVDARIVCFICKILI